MTLESTYNIGDSVFIADYVSDTKHVTCPDCLGARLWEATAPSGESHTFDCPTCYHAYYSRGYLSVSIYAPKVRQLTVGRVTFEPNYAKDDNPLEFKYMCVETGIGTGTVYNDDRLFKTYEEAVTQADYLVAKQTAYMAEHNERTRQQNLKDMYRRKRAKLCPACDGTGKKTNKVSV